MSFRKIFHLTLLCLVLAGASQGFAASGFKKTKIAVLDFVPKGKSFATEDMGGIVAEWFTTALVQDGRFEVVERVLLQKILEEQKLGMTGLIDESSSAEIGKILGVKSIISGSVLQLDETIEVNARIINVVTGSIVAAENIRSSSGANLKTVIEELTAKIVKNFPLTGYVVRKRDTTVVIDLGAASGLQRGMEFIVYKEGEVIKHPKTGEVLDVEQVRTGLIRITEVNANIAVGEVVREIAGQEIKYGQLVQSVTKVNEPKVVVEQAPPPVPKVQAEKEKKSEPAAAGYQRQESTPGERDTLLAGGQGPALLPLPTGDFMMGSNSFPEKPPHFVSISRPVWITTTEVTFADYEKFCLDTARPLPDDSGWGRSDDRPVINVNWHDARDYAAWLSRQTGFLYRLPYETEWEWAATSGGISTTYPWGNDLRPDMANCRDCGESSKERRTMPVRSYPANGAGLFDMAGNVWEWVEDCWVENYRNAPADQSARSISGKCGNYVIRGGGWNSPSRQLTSTHRMGVWAETRSNYIGFRLVKDPAGQLPAAEDDKMGGAVTAMPTVSLELPAPPKNRASRISTTVDRDDLDNMGK